jgi:hypothetical protein
MAARAINLRAEIKALPGLTGRTPDSDDNQHTRAGVRMSCRPSTSRQRRDACAIIVP